MSEIKSWVESHPYLTGTVLLFAVILFFILRGSSSSSSGDTSTASSGVNGTGLSSADYVSQQNSQLAASVALQGQQVAATAQTNQLNAQVAATQITSNADVLKTQLEQQTQLQDILTTGQVQAGANSLAAQVALAQTGAQVQIAGISSDTSITNTKTQADVLKTQYDDAIKSQQIISDAQTAQGQATADTQNGIVSLLATLLGKSTTPVTTTQTTNQTPAGNSGGGSPYVFAPGVTGVTPTGQILNPDGSVGSNVPVPITTSISTLQSRPTTNSNLGAGRGGIISTLLGG